MKNLPKIFILLVLVLLLLTLSSCDNGKKAFEDDYEIFKGIDHVYRKTSYQEVYDSLTKKEGYHIIVFAYDPFLASCPYCFYVLPIINEIALELNIKEIKYLDIRTMRVDRTNEYLNLVDYISKQVDNLEIRNDLLEIVVPDLYVVKNGEILGHHIATLKDDDGKFILNLNEEQKFELKSIYRNLLIKTKS